MEREPAASTTGSAAAGDLFVPRTGARLVIGRSIPAARRRCVSTVGSGSSEIELKRKAQTLRALLSVRPSLLPMRIFQS